ncbi:MAG: hypothetical protein C0405_00600 [Desulfovibrio sp.]|nr:hypothetical protein [Desulfovibrio sp.]
MSAAGGQDPEARLARDPLQHQHELTVLVTCYNEARFIAQTLETVAAALMAARREYEIIVIDDCSRDASAETIRRYLAAHPDQNIRFCPNEKNRGLACNFIEGAYLGTGKYYRLCCGDNPETLEALTHIFTHAGAADMVIPYQVQREVQGKSPMRKRISMLFTAIVNLLSGNKVKYYNALPVFMRYHVMRFPPISYGFGFQADIVTRLLDEDITFLQIRHLGAIDRKGEEATALSMRNLLSVIHSCVEIAIRRLRRLFYGKGQPRAREIRLEQ